MELPVALGIGIYWETEVINDSGMCGIDEGAKLMFELGI